MNEQSQKELGKTRLNVPTYAEQQRIATCLSALDAQLAAASKKLAALKAHKNGLMQQLFPAAEGEA